MSDRTISFAGVRDVQLRVKNNGDGTYSSVVAIQGTPTIRVHGNPTWVVGVVPVGTAAVQIVAANANRARLRIANLGGALVLVGDAATVTTGNGYPIPAGGEREFSHQEAVFAISGTAGQDVRFSEESVA